MSKNLERVLLIGSGGREHSLARKLADSPLLETLFIAPGNPGTSDYGKNIPIKDNQVDELLHFATENAISLCIVGPEAPLVLGISDRFEEAGIPTIGPKQTAASLEGSKKWAKAFMKKQGIPSADYEEFSDYDAAIAYITAKNTYPIVIKADGLAAGKGVTVAQSFEEAETALTDCFVNEVFQDAGKSVVIEEFLKGEEASILAFTDGKTILPMAAAQDHKPALDGDKGANTGGMGAYSPAPIVTESVSQKVYDEILIPLLKGFQDENIPYHGIVYAGLMIDNGSPSVVEFNVRFGDPETQVVLPRLKNDLLEIFIAITENRLSEITLEWEEEAAVCVVMASGGYPASYKKGELISNLDQVDNTAHDFVIQAGTKEDENGNIVTNGGRVLGVVSLDKDLSTAIDKAYSTVKAIHFNQAHFRNDIGEKALKQKTDA